MIDEESEPFFRPNPDVVYQELNGEAVLVHLRTNAIFVLNRTGARLWALIASGLNRADIERSLVDEFEVAQTVVSREVDSIVAELKARKIIA